MVRINRAVRQILLVIEKTGRVCVRALCNNILTLTGHKNTHVLSLYQLKMTMKMIYTRTFCANGIIILNARIIIRIRQNLKPVTVVEIREVPFQYMWCLLSSDTLLFVSFSFELRKRLGIHSISMPLNIGITFLGFSESKQSFALIGEKAFTTPTIILQRHFLFYGWTMYSISASFSHTLPNFSTLTFITWTSSMYYIGYSVRFFHAACHKIQCRFIVAQNIYFRRQKNNQTNTKYIKPHASYNLSCHFYSCTRDSFWMQPMFHPFFGPVLLRTHNTMLLNDL